MKMFMVFLKITEFLTYEEHNEKKTFVIWSISPDAVVSLINTNILETNFKFFLVYYVALP